MNENKIVEIKVSSETEFEDVVEQVLRFANGRKKFTLIGDLGAGKTTFTQYFCRKIGVGDKVTSPTFSLVNVYEYDGGNRFYHLDLYRLNNLQEALDIGIEDYLYDDAYCFIEWPEIIAPLLPEDTVHIKIVIMPDLSRKILLL